MLFVVLFPLSWLCADMYLADTCVYVVSPGVVSLKPCALHAHADTCTRTSAATRCVVLVALHPLNHLLF